MIFTARRPTRRRRFCSSRSPEPFARRPARCTFAVSTPSTLTTSTAFPCPPGISGSLNELFDPSVVNQINFQTGGWDAEYGGRNAAVVNVTTKVPPGGFHGSLSTYAGAFDRSSTAGPTGFNGQSFSASGNNGPWGVFVSGGRQMSNMRLEPVLMDGKRQQDRELPQRRHRLFRLRQASVRLGYARRFRPRGQLVTDAARDSVRLDRWCVPE